MSEMSISVFETTHTSRNKYLMEYQYSINNNKGWITVTLERLNASINDT